MSSAFERSDRPPLGEREIPPDQADEPKAGSPMLDQILALTADSSPPAGGVEGRDVAALRAVAQQWTGHPFALHPVVVELIHAIVQVEFEQAEIPPSTVRAMSEQIAATLYDDPVSRRRLEALWLRLSKG
ncbi:MAG TPA: hypothetical protein VHV08_15280 [Pirellulales bacterium]|nr:hypothetical protein [Pirellulales bacterium]